MGLRDLKRDGHFLGPQSVPGATPRTFGPAELARCPRCGRGVMQAGLGTEIAVRVAIEGVGEEGQPSAYLICNANHCKARLEVRLSPAPA
jgi:hypothetical protein